MSPLKQVVAALRLPVARNIGGDLPRFANGELITAQKLEVIAQTVNDLETATGLTRTAFQPFRPGSLVTAISLNQFVQPLIRVGQRLGVVTTWKKFPLKPGDLVTAETLNELVDTINTLRHHVRIP